MNSWVQILPGGPIYKVMVGHEGCWAGYKWFPPIPLVGVALICFNHRDSDRCQLGRVRGEMKDSIAWLARGGASCLMGLGQFGPCLIKNIRYSIIYTILIKYNI